MAWFLQYTTERGEVTTPDLIESALSTVDCSSLDDEEKGLAEVEVTTDNPIFDRFADFLEMLDGVEWWAVAPVPPLTLGISAYSTSEILLDFDLDRELLVFLQDHGVDTSRASDLEEITLPQELYPLMGRMFRVDLKDASAATLHREIPEPWRPGGECYRADWRQWYWG